MKQTDELERNILVVDDEPMNAKLVQRFLKDEPLYTIFTATSGQDGLDIIEAQSIDLVLLDIEMPGMDGFETLAKIREIAADVPVVFMTANKELETIQRASKMGVEDYVTKPFIKMALEEVVHSLLH